jgi:hypothetical protein
MAQAIEDPEVRCEMELIAALYEELAGNAGRRVLRRCRARCLSWAWAPSTSRLPASDAH